MGKKVKEYKTGDFIFAKVKGYPAWPARVQNFNGKKYMVYFYGTGETANLPPNMIFDYAENKDKFLSKAVKRRDFNEGVQQIAHDFANNVALEDIIGTIQPLAAGNDTGNDTMEDSAIDTTAPDDTIGDTTAANTPANDTAVEDSDEAGALIIDEGKQQPGKTRKSKAPEPAKTPKTPATPRARGKGLAPTAPTPRAEGDEEPKEEIVSRSGRKIRPKRYLDEQTEENATLPAPAPKKKRGASPAPAPATAPAADKETPAHKETDKKEKEKPAPQSIKQFNNVLRSELEELKEPFKPENPDNENILIAYLPAGQYVGIRLFQHRPNAKDEAARLQWDRQSARNALLLAQRLERGDITPQSVSTQLVTELILTDEERATLDKQRESEEKKYRIQFLKTEMRLIELDAKIKTCLCLERADTELCLTLLDQLTQLDVKPLMLLKHPTCLETVKRMRAYVGNTPSWDLTDQQALTFGQQAHRIRKQAHHLYKGLKELFPTPDGISFWEYFSGQVLQFKQATATLGADQLLELVHEPIELSQPSAVTMSAAADPPKPPSPPPDTNTITNNDTDTEHQPAQKKNARTKKATNNTATPPKQTTRRHSARRDKTQDADATADTTDAPVASGDTQGDNNPPHKEAEVPVSKDSEVTQPCEPEPLNEAAGESPAPASGEGKEADSAHTTEKDSEMPEEQDKTENDISKEDTQEKHVTERKDSTDKPTTETPTPDKPKRSGRSKKNSEREDGHSDKKESNDKKEINDKKDTSDKKANSDKAKDSDKNKKSKDNGDTAKDNSDKEELSETDKGSDSANSKEKSTSEKVKENSEKVKESSEKVKANSDNAKESGDSGNGEEKEKEDEPRAKRSRGENKKADPPAAPSRPSLQRKSKA